MFSIKQSFADCSSCKLLDAPSCICETNCKDDLSKVDIIFIAMNPGKKEVKYEIPLCGKAGKIFRKYFDKYVKNKFNYLLTNIVLCATIEKDGTTGNPDNETAERCKINCFELIKQCNPKIIVVMGSLANKCFGINGAITNIRGETFNWGDYRLLPTIHPSYLTRKRDPTMENKFSEDIKKSVVLLGANIQDDKENGIQKEQKGIFYYQLSDQKFYEEDYALIDVQHLNSLNQVLFIFKDKDGNKYYHRENDKFICYQSENKNVSKKLMPYDQLYQISIPYVKRSMLDPDITYESDVKIETKHAQDYYLKSKGEPDINLDILYTDIEVYNEGKDFPLADEANYPVVMITDYFKEVYKVYVLDLFKENIKEKIDFNIENTEIYIYDNEKKLLQDWIKNLKNSDPDVLSGFNCIPFDITYLMNRAKKFNINKDSFSRFGDVYIDGFRWACEIPGMIVLDELSLYKEFTFTQLESYSLENISQKELGYGKSGKSFDFASLFKEDINSAINYNIVDVKLLVDLNEKLQHIFLQNELRRICGCDFKSAKSQLGRLDSLLVLFSKQKGLSCKTSDVKEKDHKYEGAYVHPPIPGVHDYIVDFDFSSLYPSLILTYNIGINTLMYKLEDPYLGYDLCYHQESLPEEVNIIIDPGFQNKKEKIKSDNLLQKINNENLITTVSGCLYKKHENEMSIYAEILEQLLSSRKSYKNMMFQALESKNKSLENLYDTKQQVYKILANAMYGVLGNNVFRFFNLDLARSITLSGQEAIKQAIMKGNEYVEALVEDKSVTDELFNFAKKDLFANELDYKTPYIITGDTDSIFVNYQDLIEKEGLDDKNVDFNTITDKMDEWNEELQNYLNRKIIYNIVTKHNVNPSKNRLDLKNELLIRRGLFLTKKRYAIYVVKKEGKVIDKINNMGLDTKRSDYPSYTKYCLEELLDIILRDPNMSINKIVNFIDEKEHEFRSLINNRDKRVARPASFSKRLKDYKTIPIGVRGMLNWNKLMYEIFDVGSKGHLFRLNAIDLQLAPENIQIKYEKYFRNENRKLDVIVVPEEDELPEYLIPNTEEMLKFSWIDRYKLMLEPMLNLLGDRYSGNKKKSTENVLTM